VVDAIFFAMSAVEFVSNPSWANAGWLALDTISALPIIPSIGYFRYGDEAVQLYNRIADVVRTIGTGVADDLLKAIKRFGGGNHAFPTGAHIGKQFFKIAHIPGADKLIKRLATTKFPTVKGYTFALDYIAAHADEIAEIEKALPNRRSIDIVLKDGKYIDFKNYDWTRYVPEQLDGILDHFLIQLSEYLKSSKNVEFIFKGSVPKGIKEMLEKAGASVSVVN
jgi:hypothetical protein